MARKSKIPAHFRHVSKNTDPFEIRDFSRAHWQRAGRGKRSLSGSGKGPTLSCCSSAKPAGHGHHRICLACAYAARNDHKLGHGDMVHIKSASVPYDKAPDSQNEEPGADTTRQMTALGRTMDQTRGGLGLRGAPCLFRVPCPRPFARGFLWRGGWPQGRFPCSGYPPRQRACL